MREIVRSFDSTTIRNKQLVWWRDGLYIVCNAGKTDALAFKTSYVNLKPFTDKYGTPVKRHGVVVNVCKKQLSAIPSALQPIADAYYALLEQQQLKSAEPLGHSLMTPYTPKEEQQNQPSSRKTSNETK